VSTLSIVTPVYNEEESITIFYTEVVNSTQDLDLDLEIIFCVDPSTDRTTSIIEEICRKDERIKMIIFSKRVGQDLALMAGLEHASGDCVVLMDSDLQDPPTLLPELVQKWNNGSQIVLAQRISRDGENFIKIFTSKLFYKFMRKFSDSNFPENTGDFRLIDRKVVNKIIEHKEQQPFMRAVMSSVGYEITTIGFERPKRFTGKTKYSPLFGGYKIAFKSVVNYSNLLLKLNLIIGLTMASISFLFALIFVIAKILGADFASGVTTIVFSIWFLGGIILTSIGTVGLYVDKILNEVKLKPRYIIAKSVGFKTGNE
jgi:glycosyltransferase involved in cell wall biosynthesis